MILKFYISFLLFASIMLLISIASKKKSLRNRLLTLIILLNLVCGILWVGSKATLIFLLLLLVISLKELSFADKINLFFPFLGLILAVLGFYFRSHLLINPLLGLTALFTLMGFFLVFIEPKDLLKKILFQISSVFFIPFGLLCLALLVHKDPVYFITIIVLVQFSDIFAYLGGKSFGNHKILPKISPNKTLEGFISSFIGVLIALVFLKSYLGSIQEGWKIVLTIYLPLFFIFANIGDLVFSRLKRLLDIKDFGRLLPDHGGILDRIDNIIFCSPLLLAIQIIYGSL